MCQAVSFHITEHRGTKDEQHQQTQLGFLGHLKAPDAESVHQFKNDCSIYMFFSIYMANCEYLILDPGTQEAGALQVKDRHCIMCPSGFRPSTSHLQIIYFLHDEYKTGERPLSCFFKARQVVCFLHRLMRTRRQRFVQRVSPSQLSHTAARDRCSIRDLLPGWMLQMTRSTPPIDTV